MEKTTPSLSKRVFDCKTHTIYTLKQVKTQNKQTALIPFRFYIQKINSRQVYT